MRFRDAIPNIPGPRPSKAENTCIEKGLSAADLGSLARRLRGTRTPGAFVPVISIHQSGPGPRQLGTDETHLHRTNA
jgi:hypothetical protein